MSRHPLDFDCEDDDPPAGDCDALHALPAVTLAWLVFFTGLLVLGSCGPTRESAKAVVMADQSLAAAQQQLEKEAMPLDQGPDAMLAWATRAYDRVVVARRLLAPVRVRLSIGSTPAEVDPGTTAAMAAASPADFDARADAQSKQVLDEADAAGFWDRLGVVAAGVLKTAASSCLGVALGGAGGGLGLLAIGAKAVLAVRQAKAVADEAVAYGNHVTELVKQVGDPDALEQLAGVQRDAIERQAARGVWHHVDRLAKAKRPPRAIRPPASAPEPHDAPAEQPALERKAT